jgi:hypothetical protein
VQFSLEGFYKRKEMSIVSFFLREKQNNSKNSHLKDLLDLASPFVK